MRPPLRFSYSSPGGYSSGTVRAHSADPDNPGVVGALTFHGPKAWVDVDEEAGTMIGTSQARIMDAGVDSRYQRQGIGSELHRIASRELGPGITLGHSGSISEAGHAFAKATGGDLPKSARRGATIEDREPFYPSQVASWASEEANGRARPVEGSPAVEPAPKKRIRGKGTQLRLDV